MNLALNKFVDELAVAVGPGLADAIDDAMRDLTESDDSEVAIRWSDWLAVIARQRCALDQKLHAVQLLIRVERMSHHAAGGRSISDSHAACR
jgi:hypothetical protein